MRTSQERATWPETPGQAKRAPNSAADWVIGRTTQGTTKPPRTRLSKQQRHVRKKRAFTDGRANPNEISSSTDTQDEPTRKGGKQEVSRMKPQKSSSQEISQWGRPTAEGNHRSPSNHEANLRAKPSCLNAVPSMQEP